MHAWAQYPHGLKGTPNAEFRVGGPKPILLGVCGMAGLMIQEVVLGDREFRLISDLVYEHCGINLHDGKKELVRARLAKRLREGNFRTFSEYIRYVRGPPVSSL